MIKTVNISQTNKKKKIENILHRKWKIAVASEKIN